MKAMTVAEPVWADLYGVGVDGARLKLPTPGHWDSPPPTPQARRTAVIWSRLCIVPG